MTRIQWDRNLRIEDPRNHSYETVERLRTLLADGAAVREDPQRVDFYEVHDDASIYYVYASPITGKVYLLATWQKQFATVSA